jgi:ParB family chromosome partitioning protein
MEEAQGLRALLNLDEPKYSIEQIAAKTEKSPAYCAARLKLTELAPVASEAFWSDEIGVGHALLLAKLQPAQQEEALAACWQEAYGSGSKPKRILLPVRHLQQWIEQNVMLILKDAPFDCKDAQLVTAAGSCLDCSKRTGHNKLLFAGLVSSNADACSDPACYSAKLDAHVKQTIAAKPKLVQITTAYGKPTDGSPVVPRNRYVEIREDKPQKKEQRDWPEYKSCKFTTEAIVAEGSEKGEFRKVCANPECPVHHPKKQGHRVQADAATKAAQEKQRREEAMAQATRLRVLKAIGEAVPVRLMKRDLLFIVGRLTPMLDERKLAVLIRQHDMGKLKEAEVPAKLLAAFLPKADEGKLGRILVETTILLYMRDQADSTKILREAAQAYKVDVEDISAKVKQEFAAKEKSKTAKKTTPKTPAKPQTKAAKKTAA